MKKYSTNNSKKFSETLKHLQESKFKNIEAMTKL